MRRRRRAEPLLQSWFEWVGSVGGIGLIPRWGSTAVVALWAMVYYLSPALPWPVWASIALSLSLLGVVVAYEVEKRRGREPGLFILDDLVGVQVALLGVEQDAAAILAAAILVRLFIVVRPPPVSLAVILPGGVRVFADDWMAGALTRLILWTFAYWGVL